jgi:low temperature requirement protein LtrA
MTTSGAGDLLRRPADLQRATFLELFFDLVFVLALAQLSSGLLQNLTWSGAYQTMVLLLALWWIWSHTTGTTDTFDPRRPSIQLLVIAAMLGSLVMAAAAPEAFGAEGLAFAGAYVAMQVGGHVVLVLLLRGREEQRAFVRIAFWFGVSAVPWIGGALAHETARAALWSVAVVVDYTAIALRLPTPGLGRLGRSELAILGEHLAERYRQFFIIALGELILVIGLAIDRSTGLAADLGAAVAVSFATTVLFWRIYIYRAGELFGEAIAVAANTIRVGLSAVYSHLVMVAGIVITAVGIEVVIAHPFGNTRPAWIVVILGGPTLFLSGRAIFEYAVFGRVSRDRPIGVLVLAVLVPATLHLPSLLPAVAATAVLAGVAIADAARARGRPPEPPSPPGGTPVRGSARA